MKERKDIDIYVGRRIKMVREAAGYTQEEFAEIIQMGTKNISAVERGVVGVSLSTIKKLCAVLSISSDTLLMDKPDDKDIEKLDFLIGRLNNLTAEEFDIAIDMNNKLFEAFALNRKKQ